MSSRAQLANATSTVVSPTVTALATLLVALGVPAAVAPAAAFQQEASLRQPAALEIMRGADAALAAAGTLQFDFEMTGTFAAAGRTTGHAVVERSDGFVGMRYRAAVTSHVAPPMMRRLGAEVEVASDGQMVWLLEHTDRELHVGSTAGGAATLQAPLNQFVMPMMFRPLQTVEIDLPERMSLAGTAEVGGVECDVVYLDFPDDSGFGEQYFYVGRGDRLPRRVVLVAQVNGAVNQFDFVMTDLRAVEPTADVFRLEVPEGYRLVDDALDVAPGAEAGGWELTTSAGETIRLEELRGKVVVLDFFASWCPFCRTQLPMVSELARELEGRPVEFYGVNAWETGDALAFLEEIGAALPVFLEGDDLAERYRIASTATIVIISPEGRFLPRQFGNTTREALLEAIRSVLPTSSGAPDPASRVPRSP
jgi:thiol-disulfide isomerase/thioredoxin